MRAALYARYSTDRQRETSIGDQLRAAQLVGGRLMHGVWLQRLGAGVLLVHGHEEHQRHEQCDHSQQDQDDQQELLAVHAGKSTTVSEKRQQVQRRL